MEWDMDKENLHLMHVYIKESGWMDSDMDLEKYLLAMEEFMKDNLKKEWSLAKAECTIQVEIFMKESGKMMLRMIKALWNGWTVTKNILENGLVIYNMVLEFIFGLTAEDKENIWETDMKDNGRMV